MHVCYAWLGLDGGMILVLLAASLGYGYDRVARSLEGRHLCYDVTIMTTFSARTEGLELFTGNC